MIDELYETRLENYIEDNIAMLEEKYSSDRLEEWCCEDQLYDLVHSDDFYEWCEEQFMKSVVK